MVHPSGEKRVCHARMLRRRYGGRVVSPVFQNAKMFLESGVGGGGESKAGGSGSDAEGTAVGVDDRGTVLGIEG